MGKDNSFLNNASSHLDKLMQQQYISKANLLSLKQQFKKLKEADGSKKYTNFLNRITGIANRAQGKNNVEILKDFYDDFTSLIA